MDINDEFCRDEFPTNFAENIMFLWKIPKAISVNIF